MKTFTELLPETKSEKHGALQWEPNADDAMSAFAGALTISGKRSFCKYAVTEFPADMPGRAFMLTKADAGTDSTEERYACFVGARGANLCECKGFAYAGRCKHLTALATLIAAGQL